MRALMTTGANLVETDSVKSSDRERRMKFSTVELEALAEEASKRIVELRKEVEEEEEVNAAKETEIVPAIILRLSNPCCGC